MSATARAFTHVTIRRQALAGAVSMLFRAAVVNPAAGRACGLAVLLALLCIANSANAQPAQPAQPAQQAQGAQGAQGATVADAEKSFAIPALEIVGFDFLLSNYNRHFSGSSDYDVTGSSIRRNLRGPWVVDNDPFRVNQFLHPYQGSLYHGAARASGLSYWQASALTFAGSALWEIAGEKTPPARNDQIASGIAGSFLGEPLFRIARLVTDRSDLPYPWRNWVAAAVSPPVGLNKLLFGTRFDGAFVDHNPAYYGRLHLGASRSTQPGFEPSERFRRNTADLDLALEYGLPGQADYAYRRPFDYFSVQAQLSSANAVEALSTRGLLWGTDYALRGHTRGIWGLYANYDYLAPQIFHVSTTSLSIGTTAQWWATRHLAVQGTALLGLGYSAASTARGVGDSTEYHYGTASRGELALRVINGTRASLDVTATIVSVGRITRRPAGRDEIARIGTALTWRLHGPHAIGISYVWSHRSASFPGTDGRRQSLAKVGLFYALLGQQAFGAVDWRDHGAE